MARGKAVSVPKDAFVLEDAPSETTARKAQTPNPQYRNEYTDAARQVASQYLSSGVAGVKRTPPLDEETAQAVVRMWRNAVFHLGLEVSPRTRLVPESGALSRVHLSVGAKVTRQRRASASE